MRVESFRHFILIRNLKALRTLPFKRISSSLKIGYDLGDHPKATRTHSKIKLRKLLEDIRPKSLNRASHQSNDARTVLKRIEIAALADGLLLRLLPHRAGIDDYDIGISLTFSADVPCCLQHRPDSLGVAHIHLTAVCMDMEFHRSTHSGIGQNRKPAKRPNATPNT